MRKNILLFLLLSFTLYYGQNSVQDNVPRNRLLSDDELMNLLDLTVPQLKSIYDYYKRDKEKGLIQLAEYFRKRNNVNYFFNNVSLKERLASFGNEYPDAVVMYIEDSKKFLRTFGTDIDWKLPSVDKHGRKLNPNALRYVSRFERASEMALASYYAKDDRYVKSLLLLVKDFIRDYENKETEIGGNDLFERFYAGHRLRNLLQAYHFMLGADYLDWKDQIFLIKLFLLHGARIVDVSKVYNYGNHQTHGLEALYETTLMFPEFTIAKLWNKIALNTLMEHIKTEVMEDGFQFERASHYFKLELINYFRVSQLSRRNNVELPELFRRRFHRMFDAIVKLALPSGELPVLQDAQATYGAENDSLENLEAAELPDIKTSIIMTIGAAFFLDKNYKSYSCYKFPSELYWFFSAKEIEDYHKLIPERQNISSAFLEQTKYFVMRSGSDSSSLYLLVDAGLAKLKPDHTHGGVLGIVAHGYGEELLPSYRVRYSDVSIQYMKNSLTKNVALADRYLQGRDWIDNHARTGFGKWNILPEPLIHDLYIGSNFDYIMAEHNGFDTLGVNYNREILFVKPYFWLLTDNFTSKEIHNYQQIFQGEYERESMNNGVVKHKGNVRFYILQADQTDMDINKISKYGIDAVLFEKHSVNDYSFNTLLFPTLNDKVTPSIRKYNNPNYVLLTVTSGGLKADVYIKKGDELKLPEIKTDAQFVCILSRDEEPSALLLYKGSYVRYDGLDTKQSNKSVYEYQKSADGWKLVNKSYDK
ncbi:heparinase III protein [Melioribacter roseus P3M-2]|uniref:Heparinase III protein n=1 Tax=Melioribacter roseus (strain DSM 23840 / JCM 17771 / VKM B-2668 / P3M-2) TaxID=1191523 RepID=I6Z611_MELRP|nr:heparinase II/III family protein [Melioribacter roseus]AFN74600.1 heparinase III protein [Melioribacter roseus P3M-2]